MIFTKTVKLVWLKALTVLLSLAFSATSWATELDPIWVDLRRDFDALIVDSQFDMATDRANHALSRAVETGGAESENVAAILSMLSNVHGLQGNYQKALEYAKHSLRVREQIFGLDHPRTAYGLNDLAAVHIAQGQLDMAFPLLERALAIAEGHLGPDHPDTATGINNLAFLYDDVGQYGKSLELHRRSLGIREKVLGKMHPQTADSLDNLAFTFVKLARYAEALNLQRRALEIRWNVLGPSHPSTGISIGNIGNTYDSLGQHGVALPFQEKALAIQKAAFGDDHPNTATGLNNLGGTYSYLGRYEEALSLANRALEIRVRSLGDEHPRTAESLHNLAYLYQKLEAPESAILLAKASVNRFQMQRGRIARIDAESQRSFTNSVSLIYQNLADLLISQGRLDEAQAVLDMLKEDEQFEFVRRSDQADPRHSRAGYTLTEQQWMSRYKTIAGELGKLGAEYRALQKKAPTELNPEEKLRQKALSADLQVAQKAFNAFLNEMRESFAVKGPARTAELVETSQAALRETQKLLNGLGDDVVLLQYYVTDDKVGMLLTTPGVQIARSSAINVKDMNRQISELRRQLRDPKSNPLALAQALYKTLIGPVESDLTQAGARTVMLSLDGALRYLPFAVLHDGQRYALERWNMPVYTSVTRDRLRAPVAPRWQAAGLGVTHAMGEFPALPAVRYEIASVVSAGVSPRPNSLVQGVLPGEVYLDEAFDARRFKEVSQRRFELVHVASHFRFSPGTEVNSFLLLGDGQKLTLGDIRTHNYRFDNVDLLTLSACDTGLGGGRDERGREIEGFGVIAQQQGAKAVLATLWPVADQSTSVLMADMYRRRQALQLSKIEALRQAQLALMRQPQYVHPFYWAPFILMGNWK